MTDIDSDNMFDPAMLNEHLNAAFPERDKSTAAGEEVSNDAAGLGAADASQLGETGYRYVSTDAPAVETEAPHALNGNGHEAMTEDDTTEAPSLSKLMIADAVEVTEVTEDAEVTEVAKNTEVAKAIEIAEVIEVAESSESCPELSVDTSNTVEEDRVEPVEAKAESEEAVSEETPESSDDEFEAASIPTIILNLPPRPVEVELDTDEEEDVFFASPPQKRGLFGKDVNGEPIASTNGSAPVESDSNTVVSLNTVPDADEEVIEPRDDEGKDAENTPATVHFISERIKPEPVNAENEATPTNGTHSRTARRFRRKRLGQSKAVEDVAVIPVVEAPAAKITLTPAPAYEQAEPPVASDASVVVETGEERLSRDRLFSRAAHDGIKDEKTNHDGQLFEDPEVGRPEKGPYGQTIIPGENPLFPGAPVYEPSIWGGGNTIKKVERVIHDYGQRYSPSLTVPFSHQPTMPFSEIPSYLIEFANPLQWRADTTYRPSAHDQLRQIRHARHEHNVSRVHASILREQIVNVAGTDGLVMLDPTKLDRLDRQWRTLAHVENGRNPRKRAARRVLGQIENTMYSIYQDIPGIELSSQEKRRRLVNAVKSVPSDVSDRVYQMFATQELN